MYKIFIFACFTIAISNQIAASEVLKKGLTPNSSSWLPEVKFLYLKNYFPYSVITVGDSLYTFRSGLSKYSTISKKKLMGLNFVRWPQELQNKKVSEMYTLASEPEFAQNYSYKFSNSNPAGKQSPVMGCLAQLPLRYGDLDEDGKDELVLFLGHENEVLDLVMFNPEKEKYNSLHE